MLQPDPGWIADSSRALVATALAATERAAVPAFEKGLASCLAAFVVVFFSVACSRAAAPAAPASSDASSSDVLDGQGAVDDAGGDGAGATDDATTAGDTVSGDAADTEPADAASPDTDPADAAVAVEPLNFFVTARMADAHVPGLAVAIVRDGKLVFTDAWGYADLDAKEPVTPDHVFLLGTGSQLVTGLAVMRLAEEGTIDLDAAVDTLAGFAVRNPAFDDTPVTARQLLAHTSSVDDDFDAVDSHYSISSDGSGEDGGDYKLPLGAFLADVLVPGGDWYDGDSVYTGFPPGENHRLSQTGIALAGWLVEKAAGQGFDTWCEAELFAPLGLQHTSFRLADLNSEALVEPQGWNDSGGWDAYGHYGFAGYPSTTLRSTAAEAATLVAVLAGEGSFGATKIVSPATVAAMEKVVIVADGWGQGLGVGTLVVAGAKRIGQVGGDYGAGSVLLYAPDSGVSVAVVSNGDWAITSEMTDDALILEIAARLFADAEKM